MKVPFNVLVATTAPGAAQLGVLCNVNVLPALVNQRPDAPARSFVLYPGAPVPRIGIELAGRAGPHRVIAVDPLTGFSHVQALP